MPSADADYIQRLFPQHFFRICVHRRDGKSFLKCARRLRIRLSSGSELKTRYTLIRLRMALGDAATTDDANAITGRHKEVPPILLHVIGTVDYMLYPLF